MSVAKQAPGGAAAPMAAGANLEAMRRRVRLSRLAVWTVIAAGPVALAVALASTPTTVAAAAAAPATPTAVRTAAAAADPAGYAQLFLATWLRTTADDATSAQARLAQALAPDVDLPDPAPGAQAKPASVTAVRSAQRGGGTWSVTVAAQSADGSVRYYAVPVAMDRTGAAFTVTGPPSVVPGPGRAEAAASPYGVTVPDGDLSSAVGEFLGAYLTGSGEVGRYLAPGVALTAVAPAPYTGVTVGQVLAVDKAAAAEEVPGDGTRIRIATRVEAWDAAGRWPLAYELVMRARSGRWEVAALESGAARAGGER
ncbi:conjugal transfer protein [Streptomyces sp. NPDC050535]|uniref:conjugal transfer protein n=1 Tax=Streptomyces sp. NPDC050535 TaxID=3365626 RepID=UPI0037BA3E0B